jgi:hypothetical protein
MCFCQCFLDLLFNFLFRTLAWFIDLYKQVRAINKLVQFIIEALFRGFRLLTILILAIKGRLKSTLYRSYSFKYSIRGTCLRLNRSN